MAWPMEQIMNTVPSARPSDVTATRGSSQSSQSSKLKGGNIASTWHPPEGCASTSMSYMVAAFSRVCCCRGEITWTSRGAGRPQHQLGRRMSTGLASELETRFDVSFDGGIRLHTERHWKSHPGWHWASKYGHHCQHSPPDGDCDVGPEPILQTTVRLPVLGNSRRRGNFFH